MITYQQSNAARALLGWNKSKLAEKSGVDLNAISRFEKGTGNPTAETVQALEHAFVKADIEFTGKLGVAVKEDISELITGKDSTQILWNKILNSFDNTGAGEILVTHVDETRGLAKHGDALLEYIGKLKDKNITERLLSKEGDYHFLVPPHCYRWLPEPIFNSFRTCYVFNGCLAIQCWESSTIIFIRNQKVYEAEKAYFEKLWLNAKSPQLPKIVSSN